MNWKVLWLLSLLALLVCIINASDLSANSPQPPPPPSSDSNDDQPLPSEPIETSEVSSSVEDDSTTEIHQETEENTKPLEEQSSQFNDNILETSTSNPPHTTEKSILKINLINFYNTLSRKIFYGLLGNATTLLPPNNTQLTNIYERSQNPLLLSVKENQYHIEYYDSVFLYLDTFTVMNEELLLKQLIQSIQSLKLPQNTTMETRSKPLLKILFNGPKDAVRRLFSTLDEAFNSYFDFYDKGAVLPPNPEELKILKKKKKENLSNSYFQSYLGDVRKISNLINFEILYLPISLELESQPTIPLFSTVIEKFLKESENNTIPYHQYLKEEEDLIKQRAQTASVVGHSQQLKKENETAEGIRRLKDYQKLALDYTVTKVINTPEMIEKLNVNYLQFQSLSSFGKAIDQILEEMFHYYHYELIGKDTILSKYLLNVIPGIKKDENSQDSNGLTHSNDLNHALINIYYLHTYELFSTILERLIPFFNKQLQLIIRKKGKDYDQMIADHDVTLSLSFAEDLDEKRKEVLTEFQNLAYSLLPIKYYHSLFNSKNNYPKSTTSSFPSFKGVRGFLSNGGKRAYPSPTTTTTIRSSSGSSSNEFLKKNPYISQLTYPITNLWNYPELYIRLNDGLISSNHRIVTYYQSIQILPYKRKPIDISFHVLLNHPFNFRDYHQDPLLFNHERDELIYFDVSSVGSTTTTTSKKGNDGSGGLLGQLAPSALQARQRLQEQIASGSATSSLKKKSEFAREMLMFPLSVKPPSLPFSSKPGTRRRGTARPRKDPNREETGPER